MNIATIDIVVNDTFDLLDFATRNHEPLFVNSKRVARAFYTYIEKVYYSCSGPQERRSKVISMYRGFTDFKQKTLLDSSLTIEDSKRASNMAEVFKLELDNFLIPRQWL